jgi:dTDP-4-amino-4,6-dideoxygalactose transaminase
MKAGISRALFARALAAEGIPFGEGYVRPIYLEPMYRDRKIFGRSRFPFDLQDTRNRDNYRRGSCPNAEHFYEKGLLMTGLCRYPLSKKDMDDVVLAFRKIFGAIPRLRKLKEKN